MRPFDRCAVNEKEVTPGTADSRSRGGAPECRPLGRDGAAATDAARDGKDLENASSIRVMREETRPRVPMACDVIHRSFAFDPHWPSHGASLAAGTLRITA